MFARVHQAADWEHGRDVVQRALGIDHVKELYDGPLERCDGLVKKVADISREIITSESLLANVGGEVTELLELPAEIMLALRTVHRVAGCYGYALDHPEDETLVMAIIGLSLLDDPGERLSASRLIRGLEDGTLTRDDEQRLSTIAETRLEDEVGDDLVEQIGSTACGGEDRRRDPIPGGGSRGSARQLIHSEVSRKPPGSRSRSVGCASTVRWMRLPRPWLPEAKLPRSSRA